MNQLVYPSLAGVYVHLPFCDVKCAYCDFYSIAKRHVDPEFWKKYTEILLQDLGASYQKLIEDTPHPVLASIFFGGGTPSKAPFFVLEKIIEEILLIFPKHTLAVEITAEANPESVSETLLKNWKGIGINRVSVGLQSMEEATLKYLGRLYDAASYRHVLSWIKNAGFKNYSADFITGVPGQSVESTLHDLEFAIQEGVTHVSVYQLMVENGTRLKEKIRMGILPHPRDEEQEKQMDSAIEYLEARGFNRYEISNFSKNGFGSIHNKLYWTGRPYLGLGVSAHSFTGARRFYHPRSLEKYMLGFSSLEDKDAQKRDQLINLLRLKKAQRIKDVENLFSEEKDRKAVRNILNEAEKSGYLNKSDKLFMLTHKGLKFSDFLLDKFWKI